MQKPKSRALRTPALTAVRGGTGSGPSDANRILERHELVGNQGAFRNSDPSDANR